MPEPEILPPDHGRAQPQAGLTELGRRLAAAWEHPRWRVALIIAAVSDALSFGMALLPMAQWIADIVTAIALFVAIGFRWVLLPTLAIEVVPGLELFPAWTLVVAALAALDQGKQKEGSLGPRA